MSANTNASATAVESLSLAQLSDAELLSQTRSLVGRSNRLLAELLAHLGEVEARGVHRTRACSSLYTYLIYELRFSEDEAFRRVAAARLVRRFPLLLAAIGAGELHLTGLLLLGPHLTEENVVEVMARAKHRTKRELERLVRVLHPLPPVRASIEPLAPAPARVVPPEPSWEQFVSAMNPVRELGVGEAPREWGLEDEARGSGGQDSEGEAAGSNATADKNKDEDEDEDERPETHAPAGVNRMNTDVFGGLATPLHYKVQFTATEEYVQLVEEAKALLSHAAPRVTLEEIQLRALRDFVETLRKRKYGSRSPGGTTADDVRVPRSDWEVVRSEPRQHGGRSSAAVRGATLDEPSLPNGDGVVEGSRPSAEPRQRGRHVPAAVRRAVAARDGHRCTHVDASGRRCAESRRLEFHHVVPFALRRSHDVSNITLRCRAHNALAAEEGFGRELVHERINADRHDPWSKEERRTLQGQRNRRTKVNDRGTPAPSVYLEDCEGVSGQRGTDEG